MMRESGALLWQRHGPGPSRGRASRPRGEERPRSATRWSSRVRGLAVVPLAPRGHRCPDGTLVGFEPANSTKDTRLVGTMTRHTGLPTAGSGANRTGRDVNCNQHHGDGFADVKLTVYAVGEAHTFSTSTATRLGSSPATANRGTGWQRGKGTLRPAKWPSYRTSTAPADRPESERAAARGDRTPAVGISVHVPPPSHRVTIWKPQGAREAHMRRHSALMPRGHESGAGKADARRGGQDTRKECRMKPWIPSTQVTVALGLTLLAPPRALRGQGFPNYQQSDVRRWLRQKSW